MGGLGQQQQNMLHLLRKDLVSQICLQLSNLKLLGPCLTLFLACANIWWLLQFLSAVQVGTRFMGQLRELIADLDATGLHFVRCIKPNAQLQPGAFDSSMTLHQLRCVGTCIKHQALEAVLGCCMPTL